MGISRAEIIAGLSPEERAIILKGITEDQFRELAHDWQFWGRPEQQIPPGDDWDKWLILAGRGWGKALDINTPVPTPTGWSLLGDLVAGDEVFGANGMPTSITTAHPVMYGRPCFKITFSDGASVIADVDHQWTARSRADRRSGRGYRTVTTADLAQQILVAGERNWQMPCAQSLQLPLCPLPIDPWLLGFWLGDGTSACGEVTVGDGDSGHILQKCAESGAPVTGPPRRRPGSNCATYPIGGRPYARDTSGRMINNGSLHSALREIGVLRNKHIPLAYLRASEEQRRNLLAGIIDSDGHLERISGRFEVTVTALKLATGIAELVRTLGHRAHFSDEPATLNGRVVGRRYRIRWVARSGGGTLLRKVLNNRHHLAQPNRIITRYVTDVEPVESRPVRCITVNAADSLWLAGAEFLVTHNTRTGAETVRAWVKAGYRRIALVAATAADARDVLVEGESGILRIHPDRDRPLYEPSKRRLTWPNGAIATTYSADEPDRLRGPQHDAAWCDELASWSYPEAWDMLLMGLRLGLRPAAVITTTPRPTKLVRELLTDHRCRVTRGATMDNARNLAPQFLSQIVKKYEGTRLGRQELYAEVLDDNPGALWHRVPMLDAHRVANIPELRRIVVAVDPAVTSNEDSDETGIVVAGLGVDGRGYVIEDLTCKESPAAWARIAINAYHKWGADRIVAEGNQGGDMIEAIIRSIDPAISYSRVHASRGKFARAEPVAALYEQGRVSHVGSLPALEDELCEYDPTTATASPNHLDALVWAITDLMLGSPGLSFA